MQSQSAGTLGTLEQPIGNVNLRDAQKFCQLLSDLEKKTYRLPTEAEWEYACRAGTTTQFSFGDDDTELAQYGWYDKISRGKLMTVALKLPNPFGLFDMHGNAQEWCQDFFDEKWYENPQPPDPKG